MKKPKVGFLIPNLGGAGAERMMANLAVGFAEDGFEVELVLYKAEGTFLEKRPNLWLESTSAPRATASRTGFMQADRK